MQICDCDEKTAMKAFEDCGKKPKVAIVSLLLEVTAEKARALLKENDEHIGLVLRNS